MKFFRRAENPPDKVRIKAAKRLSKLSTTEVGIYAEVHFGETWQALSAYQRQPSVEAVEELRKNLSVLSAIGDVLDTRTPRN